MLFRSDKGRAGADARPGRQRLAAQALGRGGLGGVLFGAFSALGFAGLTRLLFGGVAFFLSSLDGAPRIQRRADLVAGASHCVSRGLAHMGGQKLNEPCGVAFGKALGVQHEDERPFGQSEADEARGGHRAAEIMKEISYYCIKTVKKSNRDFSLPPLSAYAKMISSSTISNAHALMLFKGCTHFKAFSSFSCRYALFLFQDRKSVV